MQCPEVCSSTALLSVVQGCGASIGLCQKNTVNPKPCKFPYAGTGGCGRIAQLAGGLRNGMPYEPYSNLLVCHFITSVVLPCLTPF